MGGDRAGRAQLEEGRAELDGVDWASWQGEQATLVFLTRDGRALLIRKKRGLGAGKINGPGGKFVAGETPLDCAHREVEEELGIVPVGLEPRGELRFQFTDGYAIHVHLFVGHDFDGAPVETDEAAPVWYPLSALPYDEMWADDRIWLPAVLDGGAVDGRFVFDGDRMLGYAVDLRD